MLHHFVNSTIFIEQKIMKRRVNEQLLIILNVVTSRTEHPAAVRN